MPTAPTGQLSGKLKRVVLPKSLNDEVLRAAQEFGVVSVKVFGSQLRGDVTLESDLDLLVRLAPGRDLLDLIGFQTGSGERAENTRRRGHRTRALALSPRAHFARSSALECMKRDDKTYLLHILDAVTQIQAYTARGRLTFSHRDWYKTVSSATSRSSEKLPKTSLRHCERGSPTYLGNRWRGLRDVLIHHYFGVNLETVWLVVENRLPLLRKTVETLLAEEPNET